jgi:hypothetical protein
MGGVGRWDPFQELLLIGDEALEPTTTGSERSDVRGKHPEDTSAEKSEKGDQAQ